ncbi:MULTISPECIES: SCO6745 family protein [unclassified Streptomyces]|uniref:SCO6745 family protein n=1 Tax=unclassified Streptomyces TaxID=2593676 RepID=UPI00324F0CED
MTAFEASTGRHCHNAVSPLHASMYFAPEPEDELAALGLERGTMIYLAGRAAPLGAVGAGTVTATFYNFNHEHVQRYIPAAWTVTTPEAVLTARLRGADRTLQRLLGKETLTSTDMAEAAELALHAAEACRREARPLYAANADLPVPEEPHLALWHAATLLREHRGDGHLAALAVAGLSGIEALVLHNATGKAPTSALFMRTRGWSAQQWGGARDQLRERGLLDEAGDLTEAGAALRGETEALTDRLDAAPYDHLGPAATARLTELAGGFTRTLRAAGAFPAVHFGRG